MSEWHFRWFQSPALEPPYLLPSGAKMSYPSTCSLSLWSTGLQKLKLRNHPGEVFYFWRPDLDDEIPDFKLRLQWDEICRARGKAWVYFACMGIWIVMSRRQIMADVIFIQATMSPFPIAYNVMAPPTERWGLCSLPLSWGSGLWLLQPIE